MISLGIPPEHSSVKKKLTDRVIFKTMASPDLEEVLGEVMVVSLSLSIRQKHVHRDSCRRIVFGRCVQVLAFLFSHVQEDDLSGRNSAEI